VILDAELVLEDGSKSYTDSWASVAQSPVGPGRYGLSGRLKITPSITPQFYSGPAWYWH
jgi:hypothetical protein